MAKNERRLVPIVSLDVEGYSRLTMLDEGATLAAVQHVFKDRVEATIGDQGGTVFKTMGDGVLAEFASAVAAVEWVSQLQQQLHKVPVASADGKTLQLRAGIVMADVVIKDDELLGEGINLTVRVQACSPPGGMAISKWMHEYLTGKTELSFVDIGPQMLKNIGHTVRVFVWHPDSHLQQHFANSTLSQIQKGEQPSHRPSVAVLPFENFSTDPEQAHFADAVVEEITATLSRIGDFLVIARNSAFTYKGRSVDVRQVGRELNVRYVVEG